MLAVAERFGELALFVTCLNQPRLEGGSKLQ